MTGAEAVTALPQLSVTVGAVGITASAMQETAYPTAAGSVNVGAAIV